MLDAIALYFRYRSSRVISLRIVTTDLDLLPCASRKGKTDSDLIRNAVLLWNNVVLCATFERKRVRFRFLRQYAIFCAVLKSIDDLFFSCEFALRFINQVTVWIDDSFFCVDELSFRRRFWTAWARKISIFDFQLATQSSVKLLSRMRTCFDRTIVLYNLTVDLIYHMLRLLTIQMWGRSSKVIKEIEIISFPFSMCYSSNLAFSSPSTFSSHFWDWQWVLSLNLFRADIVCSAQCSADFFNEFIVC